MNTSNIGQIITSLTNISQNINEFSRHIFKAKFFLMLFIKCKDKGLNSGTKFMVIEYNLPYLEPNEVMCKSIQIIKLDLAYS